MKKLDILVFGAHPDDVELSCSGTIMKHIDKGYKVGIVDLTQGELGSRGNAELRLAEAAKAAKIQGCTVRDNLGMPDGFFENDQASLIKIIEKIREYQPEIVFCNAIYDRHPDHGRGSDVVSRACFLSGLVKIETEHEGKRQEKWRPKAVYHYIQDRQMKPDFIVDISNYWEKKMEAIMAFSSQFHVPGSNEPQTPISTPEFMDYVRSSAIAFGRTINAKYGEGFVVERTVGVEDILSLT